jgi:hypothetical protein
MGRHVKEIVGANEQIVVPNLGSVLQKKRSGAIQVKEAGLKLTLDL